MVMLSVGAGVVETKGSGVARGEGDDDRWQRDGSLSIYEMEAKCEEENRCRL